MSKENWDELFIFVTKTLIPSIITITIGIAVEARRTRKLSWIEVATSFIVGCGTAYLFHEWIHETYTQESHATIAVSIITMGSYKGWELLLVFFNKMKLEDVIKFLTNFRK